MKFDAFPSSFPSAALGSEVTDERALATLIFLHTHHVWAITEFEDWPGVSEIAALTQRDAAEVIADAWPERSDKQRTDYRYWYFRFSDETPFEIVDDIAGAWQVEVLKVRAVVEACPEVLRVAAED